jgi:hypothetical protein
MTQIEHWMQVGIRQLAAHSSPPPAARRMTPRPYMVRDGCPPPEHGRRGQAQEPEARRADPAARAAAARRLCRAVRAAPPKRVLLPGRADHGVDHLDWAARARAEGGDWAASAELDGLLARRGDLDELRARTDAGDRDSADRLAHLLAERGDVDELHARTDAGDGAAARRLSDLLIKQGRGEEAERLRHFGLNPDGSIAQE